MKTYRDTMTDQDKLDLADFLASLDAERDFLRENPYTPLFGQFAPSIGHYEPDLLFTDEEDPAGQGGPHWDGTQTAFDIQEPPTAAPEGFRAAMLRLWHSRDFRAFLGAMALFLVMLAVYGN